MSFKHIVGNIYKLLEFNRISINQLARLSDISLNGLKVMMQNGLFKLESLQKIADVFGVPLFILIADEITIHKANTNDNLVQVSIMYKFNDATKIKTSINGIESTITLFFMDSFTEKSHAENMELEQRVRELKDQLKSKNEKSELLDDRIKMYKEQNDHLKEMNSKMEQLLNMITVRLLGDPSYIEKLKSDI